MLNQDCNVLITADDDVELRVAHMGLTQTRWLLPEKSNKSTPTCAIGGPRCEEGGRVDLGFFGREDAFSVQGRQVEILYLMSLNIPGQKYIERHSSFVLEIPE